jgi:hypothetical protein
MNKHVEFLNSVGIVLKQKAKDEDYSGIDDHFEEWKKSKTRKPFGAWLKGKYPQEFSRRIPNIDKLV